MTTKASNDRAAFQKMRPKRRASVRREKKVCKVECVDLTLNMLTKEFLPR